jgi:hypothetical protein
MDTDIGRNCLSQETQKVRDERFELTETCRAPLGRWYESCKEQS